MLLVKKIIFAVLLLCVFQNASAQLERMDSRKEFQHFLGVKGGVNFSWLRLEPNPGIVLEMNVEPMVGISYLFMSQYFAGILVEAEFIRYGWSESFLDPQNSYSRKLTYLEIPVLSNFVLGRKKTHLKIQMGVRIAFLLNDIETINVDPLIERFYYGLEVEDRIELGLALGGGISHKFGFGELQIDARYNASFSNLWEASDDLSRIYSQNQGMTLSFYYWFKVR